MELLDTSRAFVFDCDGTLVDSMRAWFDVWPVTMRDFGIESQTKDFDAYEHLSLEEECEQVVRDFHVPASLGQFKIALYDRMAEAYAQAPLIDGLRSFLQRAHAAGIPMGVATSTPRELVEPCLKAHGIDWYFSTIVTTGMVGRSKEHPDVYDAALDRILPGCARKDACVFEDALFGLRAASEAGYRVVGIQDPSRVDGQSAASSYADVYVRDYEELDL